MGNTPQKASKIILYTNHHKYLNIKCQNCNSNFDIDDEVYYSSRLYWHIQCPHKSQTAGQLSSESN